MRMDAGATDFLGDQLIAVSIEMAAADQTVVKTVGKASFNGGSAERIAAIHHGNPDLVELFCKHLVFDRPVVFHPKLACHDHR